MGCPRPNSAARIANDPAVAVEYQCPDRVNYGLPRLTAATSALVGEADEIGTKADIGARMSPVWGAGLAVGIVLEYSKPE